MPPPTFEPTPFPRVAFYAGLTTLIAGIVVGASGAQVFLLVRVSGPWAIAPWLLLGLGLAALPCGGSLSSARPWASWASLIVGGLATIISLSWAVYATANGLFALAPFFAALLAALGASLSLAALAPVRRYAEAQRALFADEPGAGPAPPISQPPASRPWPMIGAVSVVVAGSGALLGALENPDAADRVLLQAHLLVTGRGPTGADGFVTTREDYPYPGSPFLEYLSYEARFVQLDQERATDLADAVAAEVGWRMLAETGADDVIEADRLLWERGEARQIPLWIAQALRARGVFYHQESLLSRSFDPEIHADEDLVHLDCDQLAHLYAHVAWRLDLALHELQSPFHVYVQLSPPAGVTAEPITVETTNFRRVDDDGVRVDFMGEGIGEDYLIDADYHASGKSGTYATEELARAAGLYTPATARDITDMIVANVIVGLRDHEVEAPWADELRAHLDGTRSYVLVSNLHTWILEEGQNALKLGEPALAAERAREALAIRAQAPNLVLVMDPVDRVLLARALAEGGDAGAARAELVSLLAELDERYGRADPPTSQTITQSEALVLLAGLSPPASVAACEETLGAVLRLEEQLQAYRRTWADEACELAARSPRLCAETLRICASLD